MIFGGEVNILPERHTAAIHLDHQTRPGPYVATLTSRVLLSDEFWTAVRGRSFEADRRRQARNVQGLSQPEVAQNSLALLVHKCIRLSQLRSSVAIGCLTV